jgi:plastocyanin
VGATVTIGSNGAVSPSAVTINVGEVVMFVNNDSRSHDIESNPHPAHTDCPPINAVSTLQPGQSRNTGNFTAARTCGYHDHQNPTSAALQGTITIR